MNIGIIGAGLIGKKRLHRVSISPMVEKIFVLESNLEVVNTMITSGEFEQNRIHFCRNLDEFLSNKIDAFILASNHEVNYEYAKVILPLRKRILIEKPMGRNFNEANELYALEQYDNQINVGFNYRFMPGVQKMIYEIMNGNLGDIVNVKLILGHGGSPKDQNSWKLDKKISGGGALLDPGVHLIDILVNLLSFMGDLKISEVNTWKGFWKTGIEESVFGLGTLGEAQVFLESSVVLWKTEFIFHVLGTDGYAKISGRGRSDGPQTYTAGKRWAWLQGKNEQIESEFQSIIMEKDISLDNETTSWLKSENGLCNAEQGLKVMQHLSNMYKLLETN
jgi:predicted dehydrogenase